jgi:hypothetical protein
MTFDTLTLFGMISAAAVVAVLFTLCKLRGCNKPVC